MAVQYSAPIIEFSDINGTLVCSGVVDEHATVVRSSTDFACGCGHVIRVLVRRPLKDNARYELRIEHRNRVRKFTREDPNELEIYDRMQQVASYAKCEFPTWEI